MVRKVSLVFPEMQYLAIVFNYDMKTLDFTFLGNPSATDTDHYTYCENAIQFEQNSKEIFSSYWKPIMDLTKGAKSIKVVPDGFFYKFNPNQFKVSTKEYVFDKQYVSYITSTHDLLKPEVVVLSNKLCLVKGAKFGEADFSEFNLSGSLTGTDFYIDSTNQNWKVSTYQNEEASEHKIRSMYFPTVMHISTPAFFDIEKPFIDDKTPLISPLFNSGLFFTGVIDTYNNYNRGIPSISENDGILTVYEIMNLELDRTRLVILSSVALGNKELESGDGFYGLMRAFTVAGARNVITSIRPMQPGLKKEFLELFYSRFLETDKIQSSFKYAQQEMKDKYQDIDSWGSFIFTGVGT